MSVLEALAPAKINLGLFLGPRRDDGRHELATVMQSISLADELTISPALGGVDEVLAAGVPGPPGENLAARALAAFRLASGWDGPPQRLIIRKRIPVAAGLGGGSADAAATLRLLAALSGLGDGPVLAELAAGLGADVPAQLAPGRWLATGAGELLRELPEPGVEFGVLVLPAHAQLSTASVYAEADRLALGSSATELAGRAAALQASFGGGQATPAERSMLTNELQRAALSLCPEIAPALREAARAGPDAVLVSGSGPTVLALFTATEGVSGPARATAAAAELAGRTPAAVSAEPVGPAFASPRAREGG